MPHITQLVRHQPCLADGKGRRIEYPAAIAIIEWMDDDKP